MVLGGLPVVAYARVNHCHAPIDITFQVKYFNPNNHDNAPYKPLLSRYKEFDVILYPI
jgi:hypothetical protein